MCSSRFPQHSDFRLPAAVRDEFALRSFVSSFFYFNRIRSINNPKAPIIFLLACLIGMPEASRQA